MLLQDRPVGIYCGSELAVGMELNRALDSRTVVHDEDTKKRPTGYAPVGPNVHIPANGQRLLPRHGVLHPRG